MKNSSDIIRKVRAKVTRAEQHIQDFQLALQAFYDTKPYRFTYKEDTQAGERSYYLTKVAVVPDNLEAIAADVIQNLRAPLDHLAYQLVLLARNGTEPDWHVYYPIAGSAADYPATRTSKIKSVRQEVINAIDETEPYKGGKGHLLWQLNELNKVDKHRRLLMAGGYFRAFNIGVDLTIAMRKFPGCEAITIPNIFLRPADHLFPLKEGDKLLTEPLDQEMTHEGRFAFDVAFDATSIIACEPAIKTLKDMSNLIDSIITSFEPFFT